jgi:hypothetical protein
MLSLQHNSSVTKLRAYPETCHGLWLLLLGQEGPRASGDYNISGGVHPGERALLVMMGCGGNDALYTVCA